MASAGFSGPCFKTRAGPQFAARVVRINGANRNERRAARIEPVFGRTSFRSPLPSSRAPSVQIGGLPFQARQHHRLSKELGKAQIVSVARSDANERKLRSGATNRVTERARNSCDFNARVRFQSLSVPE